MGSHQTDTEQRRRHSACFYPSERRAAAPSVPSCVSCPSNHTAAFLHKLLRLASDCDITSCQSQPPPPPGMSPAASWLAQHLSFKLHSCGGNAPRLRFAHANEALTGHRRSAPSCGGGVLRPARLSSPCLGAVRRESPNQRRRRLFFRPRAR